MNFPCGRQFSRLSMVIDQKDYFFRASDYLSINVTILLSYITFLNIKYIYIFQLPYFTQYELAYANYYLKPIMVGRFQNCQW